VAGLLGAAAGLVSGIFGAALVSSIYYVFRDPGPDNEGGLMLVLSFPGMLVGAIAGGWFLVKLAVRFLPQPSTA
jgi:hypothetical protein